MDYLALLKKCKNSPEEDRQNRQNLATGGFVSFGSTESADFREVDGGFVSFGSTVSASMEICTDIQSEVDHANFAEAIEERAAIMEFDGGLPTAEAELQAIKHVAMEFRFLGGNGGTVTGWDDYESAVLDVVERWGDRLDLPDLATRLQHMGGDTDRATKLLIERMKQQPTIS